MALGAVCFLNSIANDFVYDDVVIVRDNPRVRALSNFPGIWLSDWWQPQDRDQEVERRHRDRLYRPLTLFTVALNYAFGGLHPSGFHAVNVTLHAIVCLLVWLVVQRLFGDAAVSSCAALLFAVHPVHSEAVANVVGRAEILAALFMLLGLLVLLPVRRVPSWSRVAGAAVLFLAALFSKETAVCYFPVVLIVLHAAGYQVDTAMGAAEGLALIRSVHPDLVIIDVMMSYSVQEGIDLAREITHDPVLGDIPLFVVTSIARTLESVRFDEETERAVKCFLTKPVSPEKLLTRIGRYL